MLTINPLPVFTSEGTIGLPSICLSDLGLLCLSIPFLKQTSVINFRICTLVLKNLQCADS